MLHKKNIRFCSSPSEDEARQLLYLQPENGKDDKDIIFIHIFPSFRVTNDCLLSSLKFHKTRTTSLAFTFASCINNETP